MNTAKADYAGTPTDLEVQLALEQIIIRNGFIVHLIEEREYLSRDVFFEQVGRVGVRTFVLILFRTRTEQSGGELGVGHGQGFRIAQTHHAAYGHFGFQVFGAYLHQFLGGVYIVLTVENGFIKFALGQRPIERKGNRALLHRHTEVSFDSFQGQAHLHIVLNVDVVEGEIVSANQGVFPTLTAADDVVIEFLDLLNACTVANGLDDELVIVLGVESAVYAFAVDELFQSFLIVVNDREYLVFIILEDDQPIVSEDFAVIDKEFDCFTFL